MRPGNTPQAISGVSLNGAQRVEVIGDATLILGDCRDILPSLGPVDAVVTDPPYGVDLGEANDRRGGKHGGAREAYAGYLDTYANFSEIVVPAIKQALSRADRGAVFLNNNLHDLPKPDAIGAIVATAATGRHCWGFNSVTLIGLYGKAPALNKGGRPTGMTSGETAERNGHPCPKPEGWMRWALALATRSHHVVLDPFMGSGTTGVACAQLDRRFIGIEREPTYFDIACRRIEQAYRQPRLFAEPAPKPVQPSLLDDVA